MNVLLIAGSLSSTSLNAQLVRAAAGHLPTGTHVPTWTGLGTLPLYDVALDTASPPAPAVQLRAAVAEADAIVIATPEYNGSIPGGLKNAIDWASRPRGAAALAGKPVAVLGASPSPYAAKWAREDLVRILRVAGAHPLERTVGLGSAHQTLVDGSVTDAEVDALLGRLVGELVAVPQAA